MPLSVEHLKQRYQHIVAPGNDTEFERLLLEADERLLSAGKWHWTRQVVVFTLEESDNGVVELPQLYQSIAACRVGSVPQGVVWQETEYYEGGPGEIPVDGTRGVRLVDQGWSDVVDGQSDSDESNDTVTRIRSYKVTDTSITELSTLCKFAAIASYTSDYNQVRCPDGPALKSMMLAIIYEEAADIGKFANYKQLAIASCDENEKSYRGLANEVFKPSMFQPVRFRSRRNFP